MRRQIGIVLLALTCSPIWALGRPLQHHAAHPASLCHQSAEFSVTLLPGRGPTLYPGCSGDPASESEPSSGQPLASPQTDIPDMPPLGTTADPPRSIYQDEDRFDFLFYGGKFVDETLRDIVYEQKTDFRESYIWVAGLNYELGKFIGPIGIETEGQLAKHTGLQDHWEANVLMIARAEFVIKNAFSFSVAIGDGFSLASRVPRLEREENPSTPKLLQYLMAELDFGLPAVSWHPRLLIRAHHRSGVFGVFCPETCGSNFVSYGVKVAF